MLRRFGFRRVLPFAQLALYILLVFIGAVQVGGPGSHSHVRPVALQEGENLPRWHPPQPHMPTAWLIAIALNVPATMLGALCAEMFHVGSNLGGLLCSMPFVLILWLLVGRWLDRQYGYLPFRQPGKAKRVACWFGIVSSAVLLSIGLMAIRSHVGLAGDVIALAIGWLAWSALLFVMCLSTLRRQSTDSGVMVA